MFHIYYLGAIGTSRHTMVDYLENIILAYNDKTSVEINGTIFDFTNTTGKIDYCLVGHSHADFTTQMANIPVIGSANLQKGNTPTFDLINVNYDDMTFNTIRIGNGENRTINL